jgi:hypothetical protein
MKHRGTRKDIRHVEYAPPTHTIDTLYITLMRVFTSLVEYFTNQTVTVFKFDIMKE